MDIEVSGDNTDSLDLLGDTLPDDFDDSCGFPVMTTFTDSQINDMFLYITENHRTLTATLYVDYWYGETAEAYKTEDKIIWIKNGMFFAAECTRKMLTWFI